MKIAHLSDITVVGANFVPGWKKVRWDFYYHLIQRISGEVLNRPKDGKEKREGGERVLDAIET